MYFKTIIVATYFVNVGGQCITYPKVVKAEAIAVSISIISIIANTAVAKNRPEVGQSDIDQITKPLRTAKPCKRILKVHNIYSRNKITHIMA